MNIFEHVETIEDITKHNFKQIFDSYDSSDEAKYELCIGDYNNYMQGDEVDLLSNYHYGIKLFKLFDGYIIKNTNLLNYNLLSKLLFKNIKFTEVRCGEETSEIIDIYKLKDTKWEDANGLFIDYYNYNEQYNEDDCYNEITCTLYDDVKLYHDGIVIEKELTEQYKQTDNVSDIGNILVEIVNNGYIEINGIKLKCCEMHEYNSFDLCTSNKITYYLAVNFSNDNINLDDISKINQICKQLHSNGRLNKIPNELTKFVHYDHIYSIPDTIEQFIYKQLKD